MHENKMSIITLINEAFDKINKFEGGNILFFQRFHKSRAVVSTWKSGKVVPSDTDIGNFIRTANDTIRELSEEKARQEKENAELLNEFQTLLSA